MYPHGARRPDPPSHVAGPFSRGAVTGLVAVVGLALGTMLSACASPAISTSGTTSPSHASPTVPPTAKRSASPTAAPVGPPVGPITPASTIPVAKARGMAFDGTALWVIAGSGAVARLDPASNSIGAMTTVVPTKRESGFTATEKALWISDFDADLVYHVDSTSLKVLAQIPVEDNPLGITAGDATIWVASHRGGSVVRIDPATDKVVATIRVGPTGPGGPHAIGLGFGSAWVSAGSGPYGRGGTVVRIDPATNEIQATIAIPKTASACGGFAFGDGAVWTASCGDRTTLVRIDPATNTVVATIDLGGLGSEALIDGHPWMSLENIKDGGPGRIVRIDPATNTIDRSVSPGATFKGGGVIVAAGSVWIVDWASEQILRFAPGAFGL